MKKNRLFTGLSIKNRIISLFFIFLSAFSLMGFRYSLSSSEAVSEASEDMENPDEEGLYIYCKNVPELRIEPYFTGDRDFCFFIPFSGETWLLHLPPGSDLLIDGTQYLNGDKMTVSDEESSHSFIFAQNGVIADWQMSCIYAEDLPAVSINLDKDDWELVSHDEDRAAAAPATFTLVDPKDNSSIDDSCTICGHGNATWVKCEKKSFEIKLSKEMPLLGMGPHKKWNFIANAMDPSNLKNSIVYEAAKESGYEYCVDSSYFNLYVNGMYYGLYLLTEKPGMSGSVSFSDDLEKENLKLAGSDVPVPVIENRETLDEIRYYNIASAPANISGSYLMEFDAYDETLSGREEGSWFRSSEGYHVLIKQPVIATKSEAEYIKDYVRSTEDAIYSENGTDPKTGIDYNDRIDRYSWAMSYLFMDFFAYQDYSAGSLFFYKKRNDDLLYSGPIWDYDKSMTDNYYDEEIFPWNKENDVYLWYEQMYRFNDFRDQVAKNYRSELSPIVQNIIDNHIPEWRNMIASSEKMDEIRWDMEPGYEESRGDLVVDWLGKRKDYYDSINQFSLSGR